MKKARSILQNQSRQAIAINSRCTFPRTKPLRLDLNKLIGEENINFTWIYPADGSNLKPVTIALKETIHAFSPPSDWQDALLVISP